MNIVFASHNAYMQGGAQGVLLDLVRGLKTYRVGVHIYMVFPDKGPLIDAFLPYIDGYVVVKQPGWMLDPPKKSIYKSFWGLTRFIRYAYKTLIYLKQIKPDFVVTNTIYSPVAALACKWGHFKHIWFIHEVPVESKSYSFLYPEKVLVRWMDRHSAKILAVSDYILEHYKPFLTNPEKMLRIHYSVEVNKNITFQRVDFCYTLLLVGYFNDNKGQREAIEACRVFKEKSAIPFRLLLVGAGDDEYSNMIRQLVKKNNLCNEVEIVPFTTDIFVFYKQADVLLMCSASEGLPKVVVEAQKFGLPVIATAIATNNELITHEYNGLFYQRGKINELVDAIGKLSDPDLRNVMSKNAMCFMAGRYKLEQFVDEFVKYCIFFDCVNSEINGASSI